MFTLNDVILAHAAYETTKGTEFAWLDTISEDDFLTKYDKLTKKQRAAFEACLERACCEAPSVEEPDDRPAYHEKMAEIFTDFL